MIQLVNGFPCHDCTDVELAKKGVDPAHPKDGPGRKDAPDKVHEREVTKLREVGAVGTRLHVLA